MCAALAIILLFPFSPGHLIFSASQHTSILFSILPFYDFMLAWITWQFNLSIVIEVSECVISGLLYTTRQLHYSLLSVNLAMCLAQRNVYFQFSMITSFTLLHSWITSLWMSSCNIISIDLSIALSAVISLSTPFVVAHILLEYNIAGNFVFITCKCFPLWSYSLQDLYIHLSAHIHHQS